MCGVVCVCGVGSSVWGSMCVVSVACAVCRCVGVWFVWLFWLGCCVCDSMFTLLSLFLCGSVCGCVCDSSMMASG